MNELKAWKVVATGKINSFLLGDRLVYDTTIFADYPGDTPVKIVALLPIKRKLVRQDFGTGECCSGGNGYEDVG